MIDRLVAERADAFGNQIRDLRPDVVVDMICFTLDSARQLAQALRGQVQHFITCGTIWVHGPSVSVPTTEEQPRRPFGEYGIQKAAIEAYLLDQARLHGFLATILHPGHIVGPGWVIVIRQAISILRFLSNWRKEKSWLLPNLGMETVHHVHAEDVAQAFWKAMDNWVTPSGESFHVVSPAALTLRGYAKSMAGLVWPAQLTYVSCRGNNGVPPLPMSDADGTWDHIAHSPNCSIAKARRLLDYQPRATPRFRVSLSHWIG